MISDSAHHTSKKNPQCPSVTEVGHDVRLGPPYHFLWVGLLLHLDPDCIIFWASRAARSSSVTFFFFDSVFDALFEETSSGFFFQVTFWVSYFEFPGHRLPGRHCRSEV